MPDFVEKGAMKRVDKGQTSKQAQRAWGFGVRRFSVA